MAPRINRYLQISLLALLAAAILAPLFYYGAPFHASSPDLAYVRAKILQILEGGIFTDPVSGYQTLHPPLFHLFLTPLKALGLGFDAILILATMFSVTLTIFLAWRVLKLVYDADTAFLVCLLIPFINDFMGSGNILLATAFYFSVPFYLCGLWLYLKAENRLGFSAAAGFVWGLTFFISPVYIFLLGLTFAQAFLTRRPRILPTVMLGAFLITISPYVVMALVIYLKGQWGGSVFAWWRDLPDQAWLKDLFWQFISPTKKAWRGPASYMHVALLLLALAAIARQRKVFWLVPAAALAYLLTYYHFSAQYAIRIHYILSMFVVATAVRGLLSFRIKPVYLLLPVLFVTVYSMHIHYVHSSIFFRQEKKTLAPYLESGERLWANLDRHLVPGRFVFCTKQVYRFYIMGHFPAHSLGAYRTMEYFQLHPSLAKKLDDDYHAVFKSIDYKYIDSLARSYNIDAAIVSGNDWQAMPFQVLAQIWRPVYSDKYFTIYKRRW